LRAVGLAALGAALAAAGCSRRAEANYRHCLKLRVGIAKEDLFRVMGPPEETLPYVEGRTPDYLKGRTAYEWSNPATMPSPDHVSVDDAAGRVMSIRCSDSDISAAAFAEAPEASTAPARAPDARPR